LGIGFLVGGHWAGAIQLAFTACGLTAVIQNVVGVAADEDFEEIFKGE